MDFLMLLIAYSSVKFIFLVLFLKLYMELGSIYLVFVDRRLRLKNVTRAS